MTKKFSPQDQETLSHLSALLHLFHHRNQNQHRRSPWWRPFSIFRRQLNHLLSQITALNSTPSTHLERTLKKSREAQIHLNVSQRISFWRDTLIPRCQRAFSQVVADGRFAVLGMVLLAVVAQVSGVVGLVEEYEELGQVEMERVLRKFAEEEWEGGGQGERGVGDEGEEVGVVVQREVIKEGEVDAPSVAPRRPDSRITSGFDTSTKKSTIKDRSKKRKRTNAIDDLFSGLS